MAEACARRFSFRTRLKKQTVVVQTPSDSLPLSPHGAGLEVVFCPSPSTFDGRFAKQWLAAGNTRGLTKLTWQNAALIALRLRRIEGFDG